MASKRLTSYEDAMARHHGAVLVDANVIIECWRVSAWKALTGGCPVEAVEMCEIETQTGLQRRRTEQQIDRQTLRATLKAVHPVTDAMPVRPLAVRPTGQASGPRFCLTRSQVFAAR
jgi:hypothetical protein